MIQQLKSDATLTEMTGAEDAPDLTDSKNAAASDAARADAEAAGYAIYSEAVSAEEEIVAADKY